MPSTIIFHNMTVGGPSYQGVNPNDCEALLSIYHTASYEWNASLPVSSVTTYSNGLGVSTETWRYTLASTSLYTSNGQNFGTLVTYSTSTTYYNRDHAETIISSITQDWAYPFSPPCTMPPLDPHSCSELQQEWYTKFNPPASHKPFPKDHSIGPGCTMGCVQCVIRGNNVDVLYWPVSTAPGQPNVTLTSIGNGTVIAEYRGHRLTSPTIYLAYDTLTATNNCGQVGATYADGILAIPSTETLSSHGVRYRHRTQMPTLSFNFADLNEPMPLSIYQQQGSCYPNVTENCPVVIPGNYNPSVNLPRAVRTLDPAWADCADDWVGVFDPPKALQSVDALTESPPPQTSPTEPAREGSVPTLGHTNPTAASAPPSSSTRDTPSDVVVSNIGAILGATPSQTLPPIPATPNIGTDLGTSSTSSNDAEGGDEPVLGSQPVIAAPDVSNVVVVDDLTLSVGGPAATIADSVISVGTNGVVASPIKAGQPAVTIPIIAAPEAQPNSAIALTSIANSPIAVFTGQSSAVAVAGTTLTVGGAAITLSGYVASIGPNGLIVASQGQSTNTVAIPGEPQPTGALHITAIGGTPVVVLAGQTGAVIVAGTTLTAGGVAVTIPGIAASVGMNGLVVDMPGQPPSTLAIAPVLKDGNAMIQITSIGDKPIFLPPSKSATIILDGITLSVGGAAATISGTVVSVALNGLVLSSAGHAASTVPLLEGQGMVATSPGKVTSDMVLGLGVTATTRSSGSGGYDPLSTSSRTGTSGTTVSTLAIGGGSSLSLIFNFYFVTPIIFILGIIVRSL